MARMRILHLSDDRPGHYHLAEGVIAALARLRPTAVTKVRVAPRKLLPGRWLRWLAGLDNVSPSTLLKMGYDIDAGKLEVADLVISAGGATLPANVAAARALNCANIFVGSLRRMAPRNFSLVVTSYERHMGEPQHLVTLKPSAIDPTDLGRPAHVPVYGAAHPPALAGLLIGGDSGLFHYKQQEWNAVFSFVREVTQAWGTRWLVSTSRRTPPDVAQAAFDMAKDKATVADFIDYRLSGPGTLAKIFSRADVIVCTEDSSTMISEAAWARLPVIGVSPADHAFKPEEAEYRQFLARNSWCRFLPISQLNMDAFAKALGEIRPLETNPLDKLADDLRQKLPELIAD